jgi:hypothetical protein
MKILFFTLIPIFNLKQKGIYPDLIAEFNSLGHKINYFFPHNQKYSLNEENVTFSSFITKANPQKQTNFFKKFLLYLEIERNLSKVIKKSKYEYDLLLIVTPSIFQIKIIDAFKLNNPKAKTILLLKDIFPDNAIDLGVLHNKFPINLAIKYFNSIEKKLYKKVNYIGCMNKSNLEYISNKHKVLNNKLFLSYNSIKPYQIYSKTVDIDISKKANNYVFLGNIGLPQNIEGFKTLIELTNNDIFFFIIGSGSELNTLLDLSKKYPQKLRILQNKSDHDYIDSILLHMDAGLILLDPNFKVPNFPSKFLSYLNASLPVIAFTEKDNEISSFLKEYKVGKWENFQDINKCVNLLNNFSFNRLDSKFSKLLKLFSVQKQAKDIINLVSKS